jgi:hypothetical protein
VKAAADKAPTPPAPALSSAPALPQALKDAVPDLSAVKEAAKDGEMGHLFKGPGPVL